MRKAWLTVLIVLGLLAFAVYTRADKPRADGGSWTAEFPVEEGELSATGRNPYFILEPGYQLVLEGGKERLTITVLDETRTLAGVQTRVVEERHTKDGAPVEVARNYFAISKRTNNVYYFGEDVAIYKGGMVVNHKGAWLAGVNGARFGLMMPAHPRLKARYFQEIAHGLAMDRAEIVSMSETVTTPAGEFKSCLVVKETSPLEPAIMEYKYHAPGIGLVQDGPLRLVRSGKI